MIPEAKVNALVADSAELSSDAIQHTSARRSKILLSIVYLWTGRGPEINNVASTTVARALSGRTAVVLAGDRARSQIAENSARIGVVVVAGGTVRRRSRQTVSRPRVVQFSLTEEEFEEVSQAAERSGLARGAFAAEAALASARGGEARVWSPVREALVEVMAGCGRRWWR